MQRSNDYKIDIDIPDEYLCPILHRIMNDPVLVGDKTFERLAIDAWYEKDKTCPLTRKPIITPWISNTECRQKIQDFIREQNERAALCMHNKRPYYSY